MSEKQFTLHLPKDEKDGTMGYIVDHCNKTTYFIRGETARKDLVNLLNEQQATISRLEEEKGYWKSKAITLLSQVCRLTPKMSAKEVIEFGKELEDE